MMAGSLCFVVGYTAQDIQAESNTGITNALENFKITNYYQPDTDGDGIIDLYDKSPNSWDVSDRDLRFFQELAYRTNEEITAIFNGNEDTITKFNQEKLLNSADIRELTNHWTFLKQINNERSGFSASLFVNGQKIIIAIRGTNDIKDIDDDSRLMFALQPEQVADLQQIRDAISPYQEYYFTGHSLGGYLAQYLIAKDLLNDPKYIHSALFNAPGIASSLVSSWEHQTTAKNKDELVKLQYTFDADLRTIINEGKSQPFGIHGDSIAGYTKYANTKWFNQVNEGSKHASTNFVATKADEELRKYFSTGYRLDRPYLSLDSDGDQLLDVDELKVGTDYRKMDSDGDGFGDYIELANQSNANNPTSVPSYTQLYRTLPTKDLFVKSISEVTPERLRETVYTSLKPEYYNLTKQIVQLSNEEVRYEFSEIPDSSDKRPTFPLTVQATYKDGSRPAPFTVNVRVEQNKENKLADYTPIATQPITIYQNDDLDLLKAIDDTSEIKTKEVLQGVDNTQAGQFSGKVRVIFTDDSVKIVDVPVTIKHKIPILTVQPIQTVTVTPIEVVQGENIDYNQALTLSFDESYQVIEDVTTENVGNYTAKLKVIFSDKSSRVITVPVHVKRKPIIVKPSEIIPIKKVTAQALSVTVGEKIDYAQALPEGVTFEVLEPVETHMAGEYAAKLKVYLENGATQIVRIPIKVQAKVEESVDTPSEKDTHDGDKGEGTDSNNSDGTDNHNDSTDSNNSATDEENEETPDTPTEGNTEQPIDTPKEDTTNEPVDHPTEEKEETHEPTEVDTPKQQDNEETDPTDTDLPKDTHNGDKGESADSDNSDDDNHNDSTDSHNGNDDNHNDDTDNHINIADSRVDEMKKTDQTDNNPPNMPTDHRSLEGTSTLSTTNQVVHNATIVTTNQVIYNSTPSVNNKNDKQATVTSSNDAKVAENQTTANNKQETEKKVTREKSVANPTSKKQQTKKNFNLLLPISVGIALVSSWLIFLLKKRKKKEE